LAFAGSTIIPQTGSFICEELGVVVISQFRLGVRDSGTPARDLVESQL